MECNCDKQVQELKKALREKDERMDRLEKMARLFEKRLMDVEARVDMREERWLEIAELCQRTNKSRSWFYNGHAEKAGLRLFRGRGGVRCLESEFRRWLKDPRPAAA